MSQQPRNDRKGAHLMEVDLLNLQYYHWWILLMNLLS